MTKFLDTGEIYCVLLKQVVRIEAGKIVAIRSPVPNATYLIAGCFDFSLDPDRSYYDDHVNSLALSTHDIALMFSHLLQTEPHLGARLSVLTFQSWFGLSSSNRQDTRFRDRITSTIRDYYARGQFEPASIIVDWNGTRQPSAESGI